MKRQSSYVNLQPFMLRQRKDCRDKVPLPFALIIVATELRVSRQSSFHSSSAISRQRNLCRNRDSISALSSTWNLLRHIVVNCDIVLLICLKFCHDKQKLCHDRECYNCHFLLFFFLLELSYFSIKTCKTQSW